MVEIKDKVNCCGCHACFNICPKNAITMQEDEYGFKYPVVDKEKCINCELCKKACPILNNKKIDNTPKAYACINKENNIRKQSSSGGVFTLIAEKIIDMGGIVFGASFDENFNVVHTYVDNKQDLQKFRGSKYVQSTINEIYKKAKKFLTEGRYVLFTGTPCQIEGLKSFLQKDYDKLYTQDIICHGVPSPRVWQKYLDYRNRDEIEKIEFRNKDKGWHQYEFKLINKNKSSYSKNQSEDLYMQAFLKNTSLRDSCYNCSFKKKNRISDITLADFWGIENVLPEMDDNKGTSLVIINSEKGQGLLEKIKPNMIIKEVKLDNALIYNQSMIESAKMDKNREKFFRNLDKIDFETLVKKYTYKPSIIRRVLRKIKSIAKFARNNENK